MDKGSRKCGLFLNDSESTGQELWGPEPQSKTAWPPAQHFLEVSCFIAKLFMSLKNIKLQLCSPNAEKRFIFGYLPAYSVPSQEFAFPGLRSTL